MTPARLPDDDRILQLLADEATEGLAPADQAELDDYQRRQPDLDRDALQRAAAAATLAFSRMRSPLPPTLERRLTHEGYRAVLGLGTGAPDHRTPSAAQVSRLLAGAPDVVRATWRAAQPGCERVAGEAAWSDARQAGLLVLRGLPANDPHRRQYQLWIIDQRSGTPVDGGVFDIPSGDEVLIPFAPRVPVRTPRAFAITLAPPGGVAAPGGPWLVVATLNQ